MKINKKLFLLISLLLPLAAQADGPLLSEKMKSLLASPQLSLDLVVCVFLEASRMILGVVGALLLVMLVYGGVLWLISGGSEKMVSKGKETLVDAVIGLAIVFGSYVIIQFILKALGAKGDILNTSVQCLLDSWRLV